MSATGSERPYREVVVGRNSQVWRLLVADARIAARFGNSISHIDLASFDFTPQDRVWVFAYSRDAAENARLLGMLAKVNAASVVYVSSASTIVMRVTRCYEYPRVKQLAEQDARRIRGGKILVLGLMHSTLDELPAGTNAATSYTSLVDFLLNPSWPDEQGADKRLFVPLAREFSGPFEAWLYRVYGLLQNLAKSWPCALRPLDYLLRACGFRWYGYIHLSNRLWFSTTS